MVSDSFSSLSVERFSFSLLSPLHFTKVGHEGGWIFKKQVRDPVLLTPTLLIPERSQAGSGQPLLEMMKILLASYRFWLGWGQSGLFWCHYTELSLLTLIFKQKLQKKMDFFIWLVICCHIPAAQQRPVYLSSTCTASWEGVCSVPSWATSCWSSLQWLTTGCSTACLEIMPTRVCGGTAWPTSATCRPTA